MDKSKRKKIIAIIIPFILYGCANQLPPGGGKVDDIPPKIIELYPPNGTINYSEDYFEITFDEYVDKRSFKDAIFISPAIDGELEISWSGRTVTAYFPEELKPDRTYTINIGTDVVDYNNRNRMAENFIFAFSTGNKIDNGVIRGNVYAEKPSGVMAFAYLMENGVDTLDITARKPDYVSQAGEKGSFTFSGLTLGRYRIFAVKDEFRDLVYDLDQDEIGIPFTDINLNVKDTSFNGLDFKLAKIDTTPPRIVTAVMTDQNHILLTFSEAVKYNLLSRNNFAIVDSTTNRIFKPEYCFKGRTKDFEYVLSTKEKFVTENDYFLEVMDFEDYSGLINNYDFIRITLSDKPDTIAPLLFKTTPSYNSQKVDYQNPTLNFYFDDGFSFTNSEKNISLIDSTKNQYPIKVARKDDAALEVAPVSRLKATNSYELKIDFNSIKDAAGNYLDSIYVYKFSTKSELDYTGVSGQIINVDLTANPIVVLESVDDKEIIYQQKLNSDRKFSFTKIDPGKYKFFCYLDKNKNEKFDFGYPGPFIFSEEFHYFDRTIDIPPRWEVTDLIFDFTAE